MTDRNSTQLPHPHKAWHSRGYLPHLDSEFAVQFVTFRLADSLPKHILDGFVAFTQDDLAKRFRLEALIDQGYGSCLLQDAQTAAIVQDSLLHFDGQRYRLLSWVVMPNHVHVLFEQMEGHRLGDVVHSWKSFTAKQINRRREGSGALWASDYFDRYIRDDAHFMDVQRYIEANPVKAGLAISAADWRFSSASWR